MCSNWLFFFLFTIFCEVLFSVHTHAQSSNEDTLKYKYEIEICTENDYFVVFATSDQFYTYGLKTRFRIVPDYKTKAMHVFKKANAFFWEVGAGLEAYTPNQRDITGFSEGLSRPFAGWLYGTAMVNYMFDASVAKFGIEIGHLGPEVNAGEIQNWFHDVIKNKRIEGWEYQVKDQFGINLTSIYARTIYTSKLFDSYGLANVSIGNIHTFIQPNLNFRFGKFRPIQQSVSLNNSILAESNNFNCFVEAGIGIRIVAYNATLQGDLPDDKVIFTAKNINNLMIKGNLSINFSSNRWLFRIKYYFSQGDINLDDNHRYGSVSTAYKFK